jgi:enoyl-CoA hydratase
MPESESVSYERRGAVAIVQLHRPDRLNAVTLELYEALERALRELADDPEVRVVVLTGAGRAFSAGADLQEPGGADPQERRAYVETGQRVHRLLQTLPKPVVAAVNGPAVGAGLELALACDLVIATENAELRFPELALGTFVGGGTTYLLAQRVGLTRAKELLLLGGFLTGAEAARIGLVNRAAPQERVLEDALALADELTRRAPIPIAHAKRLLDRAPLLGAEEAMAHEAEALLECMQSRDWREGMAAFREKRPPRFAGE